MFLKLFLKLTYGILKKNILKINIWGERDTEQMKEEKTQKSDRGQMKEEKRQKECSGESHCVVCLAWLVD